MGRSSLASFLCYANSNDIVMDFASRELLPLIQNVPVLFGINAGDPSLHFYEYLGEIKRCGFAGINNFPTVGLIDGQFRQALEEDGCTYDREVEAIRLAHFLDLFTVAYVFDEEQAAKMIEAGADVICAHLGLTTGGMLGAKRALSLEKARQRAERVFAVCDAMRPGLIKMIYGGPSRPPPTPNISTRIPPARALWGDPPLSASPRNAPFSTQSWPLRRRKIRRRGLPGPGAPWGGLRGGLHRVH